MDVIVCIQIKFYCNHFQGLDMKSIQAMVLAQFLKSQGREVINELNRIIKHSYRKLRFWYIIKMRGRFIKVLVSLCVCVTVYIKYNKGHLLGEKKSMVYFKIQLRLFSRMLFYKMCTLWLWPLNLYLYLLINSEGCLSP